MEKERSTVDETQDQDSAAVVLGSGTDDDTDLLSAEEILAQDDVLMHRLVVPEWKKADGKPGAVMLKMLSGEELAIYTDAVDGEAKKNAMILIFMRSAVKKDGTLLFSDPKSILALKKKSVKAFKRIQDKILDINGLTPTAEQLRKNA